MTDGQFLKLSIRSRGLIVGDAAKIMCITRNTLQGYFKHSILSKEIIQNVLSKLQIDIIAGRDVKEVTVSKDAVRSAKTGTDSKDETISYQKDLIESQKEVIAMLKEKVNGYEKKGKMNIEAALKDLHRQNELIFQTIGEMKNVRVS